MSDVLDLNRNIERLILGGLLAGKDREWERDPHSINVYILPHTGAGRRGVQFSRIGDESDGFIVCSRNIFETDEPRPFVSSLRPYLGRTIAHELGHTLSLGHIDCPDGCLMKEYENNSSFITNEERFQALEFAKVLKFDLQAGSAVSTRSFAETVRRVIVN